MSCNCCPQKPLIPSCTHPSSAPTIVSKDPNTNTFNYNTIFNSNVNNYNILLTLSDGTLGMWNAGFYSTSYKLIQGNTYKLVMVITGSQEFIFVNNILVATFNTGWTMAYAGLKYIGNHLSDPQGSLGLLKEVKIFNRVLSQDEINSL